MRVTQIMLGKGFGGAERSFVDLARALADMGHDVQAICHAKFAGRAPLAEVPSLRVDEVSPIARWDLWSAYRVRRLIDVFAPDVVHAHLARAAWTAGRAKRNGLPPLVAKTHNYVNLKYYRGVDRFIATTQLQVRYLLDHGVAAGRVSRIPNFSVLDPVAEVPRSTPPSASDSAPVKFLSFGRFVEKKGFDVLLRAFHALLDELPDAALTIAGDGPEMPRLEQLVRSLGLSAHVRLPGWSDEVRGLLQASDAFVLPSLDEPFGIVVLEAMSAGIPVITTRTDGPSEILDESSAYFVDAGDVQSLSQAMASLARGRAEAAERAGRALALYVSRYHRAAVVPKIVALYRELLDDQPV